MPIANQNTGIDSKYLSMPIIVDQWQIEASGPVSNDQYISVVGLITYYIIIVLLLQVVICLGCNRFIILYLVVIGQGYNRPIMTMTDILIVEVEFRLRPSIILGSNRSGS